MTLEKFERLEKGLVRLLDGYEGLKAENLELKQALGDKEREVRDLHERLKALDREKTMVREKVDGLLARLDTLLQGA